MLNWRLLVNGGAVDVALLVRVLLLVHLLFGAGVWLEVVVAMGATVVVRAVSDVVRVMRKAECETFANCRNAQERE